MRPALLGRIKTNDYKTRLPQVWDLFAPDHRQQHQDGKEDNSREHCLAIESNIARLIDLCSFNEQFTSAECFLLSCAACCHDIDCSLDPPLLRQYGDEGEPKGEDGCARHGYGSAHHIEKKQESDASFPLKRNETAYIAQIIKHHALDSSDFAATIKGLPKDEKLQAQTIDLRRCALLLKLADTLHIAGRAREADVETRRLELQELQAKPDAAEADIEKAKGKLSSAKLRTMDPEWDYRPNPAFELSVMVHVDSEMDEIKLAVDRLTTHEIGPLSSLLGEYGVSGTVELRTRRTRDLQPMEYPPPGGPTREQSRLLQQIERLGHDYSSGLVRDAMHIYNDQKLTSKALLLSTLLKKLHLWTNELDDAGSASGPSVARSIGDLARNASQQLGEADVTEVEGIWKTWEDDLGNLLPPPDDDHAATRNGGTRGNG